MLTPTPPVARLPHGPALVVPLGLLRHRLAQRAPSRPWRLPCACCGSPSSRIHRSERTRPPGSASRPQAPPAAARRLALRYVGPHIMRFALVLTATSLSLLLQACAQPWMASDEKLPRWLQEPNKLAPIPTTVYLSRYQGKTAYLVIPPCCDMLHRLYDENGAYLCAPTGGLGGGGDGKCVLQEDDDLRVKIIWRHSRV